VSFRNYSLTPITSSTPAPAAVTNADYNDAEARVKSTADDVTTKKTRKKRRSFRKSEETEEDFRTERADKGTRHWALPRSRFTIKG